jgi:hypothetical protein
VPRSSLARACEPNLGGSRGCTWFQAEKANLISQTGLYFMPATTYAPTHFRVQYNRPCGA